MMNLSVLIVPHHCIGALEILAHFSVWSSLTRSKDRHLPNKDYRFPACRVAGSVAVGSTAVFIAYFQENSDSCFTAAFVAIVTSEIAHQVVAIPARI